MMSSVITGMSTEGFRVPGSGFKVQRSKVRGRRSEYMFARISFVIWSAVFVLGFAGDSNANPEVPGSPQKAPVVLTNATIHPVSGPDIQAGTLVFEGGKITAIGKEL